MMKQYLFDTSHISHCHVYQTTSGTKVCSCTKCHQNKRHIHICEPVFGGCSLEVCSEIKEGLVYFKTLLGKIQEDVLTHPLSAHYCIYCTVCLCIIKI